VRTEIGRLGFGSGGEVHERLRSWFGVEGREMQQQLKLTLMIILFCFAFHHFLLPLLSLLDQWITLVLFFQVSISLGRFCGSSLRFVNGHNAQDRMVHRLPRGIRFSATRSYSYSDDSHPLIIDNPFWDCFFLSLFFSFFQKPNTIYLNDDGIPFIKRHSFL
jgi:hypothetical protein